jgi:hypothetical protein
MARAIARLHTPSQMSLCTKEEATDQLETIKSYLLPLIKTDLVMPKRLRSSVTKIIAINQALSIFGRC